MTSMLETAIAKLERAAHARLFHYPQRVYMLWANHASTPLSERWESARTPMFRYIADNSVLLARGSWEAVAAQAQSTINGHKFDQGFMPMTFSLHVREQFHDERWDVSDERGLWDWQQKAYEREPGRFGRAAFSGGGGIL